MWKKFNYHVPVTNIKGLHNVKVLKTKNLVNDEEK